MFFQLPTTRAGRTRGSDGLWLFPTPTSFLFCLFMWTGDWRFLTFSCANLSPTLPIHVNWPFPPFSFLVILLRYLQFSVCLFMCPGQSVQISPAFLSVLCLSLFYLIVDPSGVWTWMGGYRVHGLDQLDHSPNWSSPCCCQLLEPPNTILVRPAINSQATPIPEKAPAAEPQPEKLKQKEIERNKIHQWRDQLTEDLKPCNVIFSFFRIVLVSICWVSSFSNTLVTWKEPQRKNKQLRAK